MNPRALLVVALTLALLALPTAALAESSSKGGLSEGGSSKSSSKGGFSASKSKSGGSKPSARSPKGGASKGSSGAIIVPGVGAAPAALVHEDGSAADDVRVRGGYLSEANFDALRCERMEVRVGERRCWRCGDAWFAKLIDNGRPVYVEVFAPEGARVERLPERVQSISGRSGTYFAAADAIYAPSDEASGGYVVVPTSPGFRMDALPDAARIGAPIVAGGATYYRYLGVYYREVHEDDRTYYVASESPF